MSIRIGAVHKRNNIRMLARLGLVAFAALSIPASAIADDDQDEAQVRPQITVVRSALVLDAEERRAARNKASEKTETQVAEAKPLGEAAPVEAKLVEVPPVEPKPVMPVAEPTAPSKAPVVKPIQEKSVKLDFNPAKWSRDALCLATALYFEARGETERGQEAVAEVIMTRAESGSERRISNSTIESALSTESSVD